VGAAFAEEQRAVVDLVAGPPAGRIPPSAEQRGLLRASSDCAGETPCLFSQIFTRFARRQALQLHERPRGVWIDTDSGEVDGYSVPTLTDLNTACCSCSTDA
jgi:hypothetical protein